MSQERTDPELLLKQIQTEEAKDKVGKLKIYLGAAPGVGKTYKMLHDAYQSRMKHLDVVVGIVESHHRQEIEAMLSQFESLPLQTISYRDKPYLEFDLDAALKRDPGLILIDEMAHTNIAGLRHEKRWQDIKELLDRGMDVYTTLNVQHIESLKDDVAHIIQAPVKETVPDYMLERADAIELVDLPVDDLLKRLQEGKIYFPEQANLAAEHFFRRGNLIALRELALRVTANKVDSDVCSYRKSIGIHHIWPTTDKILVCVGASSESLKLIRVAKQIASGLQAEWMAIYVDKPSVFSSDEERNIAIKNLRFAEQLGAVTHVLSGRDIVKEVLQFARESNITQIMVSKDRTHPWRYWFRRRLADAIIENSGEINVYIVGGDKPIDRESCSRGYFSSAWPYYGLSFIAATLVTVSNLFFTSLISTGLMFAVFLVIFYVLILKYREANIARHIQQGTRASYDFGQKLLKTRGRKDILSLGAQYIGQFLQASVLIFFPKKSLLTLLAAYPVTKQVNEKEYAVAQWVYDIVQPAGLGTDTLSSSEALYMPLRTPTQPAMGVLRIQPKEKTLFSPDQLRALETFMNQMALALEIDYLHEKYRKRELKSEVTSAKNALLKTISSQLNYPLKFILEVLGMDIANKPTLQPDFDVNEELTKISMVNNNILQMIEFETHRIQLEKKLVDLPGLVELTLQQFRKLHHNHVIQMHNSEPRLPKINLDTLRIKEVFINLLDNSIKYSPPQTGIDIYIEVQPNLILVSVENTGSGIAKEDLTRIFNPFYRRSSSYYHQDSLGLGLALCRINIEAHGGQIWAENLHKKNGVAFRFTLPFA